MSRPLTDLCQLCYGILSGSRLHLLESSLHYLYTVSTLVSLGIAILPYRVKAIETLL
jgi:hypothetical protein